MPSLFVIQGRDRGHRYELDVPTVALGRDVDNTIRLQDTEVSRHHAEIRVTGDGCIVVDLESSNGTFINGERIEQRALSSGDELRLGKTALLYTAGEASTAALEAGVDIVARSVAGDSRIIRSMTHEEGGSEFLAGTGSDSRWLARARSNLHLMYRTALAVSHTLDIDELLNRIMELIFEWVDADRGCIMLINNETEQLEPRVRRNRAGVVDDRSISISKTILDYVTQHSEGVLTSNARDDNRWDTGASILQMDIREAICVPMRGRYGVVGVIYIDTSSPASKFLQSGGKMFTDEHLKLMIAIAHQAALAVEDTSYYSAMVQAERLAAMGQTIAMLSHHIKNILQGIRGGSYLLEMGLADDDKEVIQKGWHIVEKNQGRISSLVMDMLTFSKQREPELVVANINDVVGDVSELMQSRAEEADVTLLWKPTQDLAPFLFDAEGIHRAVLNVVTNAIDAVEEVEGGQVELATRLDADAQHVLITIADNGPGIAEEDLEKLFTLFVSTKGSRGTGLGLSVSQKIMEEHGGSISVASKPGTGSKFTLELPVASAPAEPSDARGISIHEEAGEDSSLGQTSVPSREQRSQIKETGSGPGDTTPLE